MSDKRITGPGAAGKAGKNRKSSGAIITKKYIYRTIFFIIILFVTGCASVQKEQVNQQKSQVHQKEQIDQPPITVLPEATYEKDVLPFIIEQLNRTAAKFYYDLDRFNMNLAGNGLPPRLEPVPDVIKGDNEISGVCEDYTSDFIDNYKGLGDIYYVKVDFDGEANLLRRIKPLERNDIIINDTMSAADFIDKTYQWIINSKAKEDGAYMIWQDSKRQWVTFYTRTRNGIIYWTENEHDYNPVTPFRKDLIRINLGNYLAERDRQKAEFIDRFYNQILDVSKDRIDSWGWGWSQGYRYESTGWYIEPIKLNTDTKGNTFLVEETPIPTPLFHAGETDLNKFSNHAWVRIIWRDRTIDIDPTWYDAGRPVEFGVVEEIIPGKINTFPIAYSNYRQLSNTKLISPLTGTLKSGASYTFIISSTEYDTFTIITNNVWNYFSKNDETGNFELNLTIPSNIDAIDIFAVTEINNHRSGVGLIGYKVIK